MAFTPMSVETESIMTEAWKHWEGQIVGEQFHLQQYLGGGERSAVYLTEYSERRPQKAAIKLVAAVPTNAERQLSRWRLTTRLSHPHLVRLFQVGSCRLGEADLLYLVMEFAEEDLSQILPSRPLTPVEARDMLLPTLDALAFVHRQGFVHRHIKPANIMAHDDRIMISSDGLRAIGESSGRPGSLGVYDAPEIARGVTSPAGDIWSLGVTLVETLTQRPPVWDQTRQEEPVLPETLPAPFLDIARHCLRRDPQRRWTAADIAARLQRTPPAPVKQAPAVRPPKGERSLVGPAVSRGVKRLSSIGLQTLQALRTITSEIHQRLRRPQTASAIRRSLVPAAVIIFVLAALIVLPRLFHRRAQTPPVSPVTSEARVPSRPESKPATSARPQPAKKPAEKKQPPAPAAALPTTPVPPRPETKAQPVVGNPARGEVLKRVLPEVPQKARDTIRGTIRLSVRVAVDPSGSVIGATLDAPGPSKYFANLALQAAQRWEFVPARADGQNVPSEWILRFEFSQTQTNVYPVQATP